MAAKAGIIEIDLQANTARLETAVKRATAALNSNVSQMNQSLLSLKKAGDLVKVSIAGWASSQALGAITSLIQKGNEFEQQFRNIATITEQTKNELSKMGDATLQLSNKLGINAVELAAAEYEILSAGITDATKAMSALEASAKLSKVGLSTVEESADLLTSAMNAFGTEASAAMDSFFKTVQDGKTTVAGLAQSFGQVAPLANQLGVSLNDLNAATAALTLSGQGASEAQTALRGAFSNLIKPTSDAAKVAKELGVEFNALAIKHAGGLIPYLQQVKDKVNGNTEVMGRLFGSVEGLNAVLALTGARYSDLLKIQSDLAHSSGSVEQAMGKQEDAIGRLWNSINNLGIKLGQWGTAIVNPIARAMSEILDGTLSLIGQVESRVVSSTNFIQKSLGAMNNALNSGMDNLGKPANRMSASKFLPNNFIPDFFAPPKSTTNVASADSKKSPSLKLPSLGGMSGGGGGSKFNKGYSTKKSEAEKEMDRLKQEAESLKQSMRNIWEVEAEEITKANKLLKLHLIDQKTYNRALDDAHDKAQKAFKIEGLDEAMKNFMAPHKEFLSNFDTSLGDALGDQSFQAVQQVIQDTLTPLEQYNQQVKYLNYLHENAGLSTEAWSRALQKAQEDLSGTKNKTTEFAQAIGNVVSEFGDKFFDTFIEGIKTGKMAFKDFVASALEDLARLIFKMTVTIPIAKAISQALGGDTGNNNQQPKAQNSGGGLVVSLLKAGAKLLGFADGGNPPVGVPSIVGERGPELFVPRSSGTIIPNHQLGWGNAGGGQSISVTNIFQISTGVQQTVRAELNAMMPTIEKRTVQGVQTAISRGGKMAAAVGVK